MFSILWHIGVTHCVPEGGIFYENENVLFSKMLRSVRQAIQSCGKHRIIIGKCPKANYSLWCGHLWKNVNLKTNLRCWSWKLKQITDTPYENAAILPPFFAQFSTGARNVMYEMYEVLAAYALKVRDKHKTNVSFYCKLMFLYSHV